MKKLISFMILLALSISLFSCAKAPEIDSATPDILTEDKAQDAEVVNPEQPENQPEQTPEQPENQPQQTPDEQQEPLDKAPPCDVTIDELFSDFEVVVSFTLEESAKDKEYTPSDFPKLDIFNVFEFNYYPEKYHPEYAGRKTVIISLNSPSKDRVLEYVDVLQKDDRVYSAEPNFMHEYFAAEYDAGFATFILSESERLKNNEYTIEDFNYANIKSLTRIDDAKLQIVYNLNDFETLKKLAHDKRFTKYEQYSEIDDLKKLSVLMTEAKKYTPEDFPYLELEKITSDSSRWVDMYFCKGGYRELYTKYFELKTDERVDTVFLPYNNEIGGH